MYPAVPYNASSIYGIIKMKWNKIKQILSTGHYIINFSELVVMNCGVSAHQYLYFSDINCCGFLVMNCRVSTYQKM